MLQPQPVASKRLCGYRARQYKILTRMMVGSFALIPSHFVDGVQMVRDTLWTVLAWRFPRPAQFVWDEQGEGSGRGEGAGRTFPAG